MLEIVNQIMSIGILGLIFLSVITLLALAFFWNEKNGWLNFIKKYALNIYLFILIASTAGSLYYSEVILYTPCKLCWWLRIFTYPQIILVLIAKYKKDTNVFSYLYWMTGLALVVSLVHNYIYYFAQDFTGLCDAAASCTAYYVSEYGFVTIPFMGLGLVLGLLTILVVHKYYIGGKSIASLE